MQLTQATSTASAGALLSTASAGALLMSDSSMDKLERLADLMASGRATVPQHLKGCKGDCFAIALQSMQWGMNPFAVAQKTHLINGVLGYESQLVAAVINSSGIAKDRFQFEWFGDWDKIIGKFKEVESRTKKDDNGRPKRYIVPAWQHSDEHGLGVKVWATLRGEGQPRVLTLLLTQARTRNSTLWTEDPKQQLAYLAQKRWARLHAPDVILGVYTTDELQQPNEKFMGMAEEVNSDNDPTTVTTVTETAEFYPQADFEKNLHSWVQVVLSGRKNLDNMLIFIQAKARLSPEQKESFTAMVKAAQRQQLPEEAVIKSMQRGAPDIDASKLIHDLGNAPNQDILYELAALIETIADPDTKARAEAVFDERSNVLGEQP